MLYQKLFEPKTPCVATTLTLSENSEIPLHFHYEFEIVYCISGSFEVLYNGNKSPVHEGDILIINSMSAHSFLVKKPVDIFWIEFVPLFLKALGISPGQYRKKITAYSRYFLSTIVFWSFTIQPDG